MGEMEGRLDSDEASSSSSPALLGRLLAAWWMCRWEVLEPRSRASRGTRRLRARALLLVVVVVGAE